MIEEIDLEIDELLGAIKKNTERTALIERKILI